MPSSENTLAFNINRFSSVNFRTLTAYMAEFVISKRIKLTANNAMKKSIKYSTSIQSPRIAYNALLFFCNFIQTDKVHTFSFRFFKMNLFGINNQIRGLLSVSTKQNILNLPKVTVLSALCAESEYARISVSRFGTATKRTCSPVFLSLIL